MTETFFNLTWLIPLLPLAAFALIVLVTNRNRLLSTWVAWLGIGLAWILGWLVFFLAPGRKPTAYSAGGRLGPSPV
jgi:NADH:ubiquinone oxidoreductase subunit 5 (subunit L)/multisubunit Na+/H+ antiporter MnhA subunit